MVESQLAGRAQSTFLKVVLPVFRFLGQYTDSDTGSWTSVFCVASPEMRAEQSGRYFERIAKKGWESSYAKDLNLAAKLESWTEDLMKKEGWIK